MTVGLEMSSRLIILQTLSLYFQHQEKAGTFVDSVLPVEIEIGKGPRSEVGNIDAALRCRSLAVAAGSQEEAICRGELLWPLLRPRARAMGYPQWQGGLPHSYQHAGQCQ